MTPTATPSPTPSPTPTPTPTPTPFVPPTVAVEPGDSILSCLERNLTAELIISLSMDDPTYTEDIFRTCLATTIPASLMFLLEPMIQDTSACALETSKTLTNEELIALAGDNSDRKSEIARQVSLDILTCLGRTYGIDFT